MSRARSRLLPPAILFTLILALPAVAAEPFDCGPFLLQPGKTTMTIVIDHADEVSVTLTWRRADGKGGWQKLSQKAARHHIFSLEELAPDTRYTYRIKGGGHDSGERSFATLPVAPHSYRFIALGDVRSRPAIWHEVSQRIYRDETEALFIVGTGDYPADGSKYDQWIDQFFAPARDLLASMPMWPAIGNHERTKQFSAAPPTSAQEEDSHYFSLFELPGNERWYRVDYQYLTLLIIDSNSQMGPGFEQYEWLREQLQAPRKRFTVAAFHHAPLTSGPHGRRNADGTPREWPVDQAQRFLMPLFEMYGVDMVLNGHDHIYERSLAHGVTYVITGGGGAPLYKINSTDNPFQQVAHSVNHYLSVDVTPASMTVQAIGVDGALLDWFVLPVAAHTAKRLRAGWQEQLRGALRVEGTGKATMARLRNPLDFTLTVALGEADEAQVLSPGQETQLPVAAADVDAVLGAPTWRGRVSLPVDLRVHADADGIPLDLTLVSDALLREASLDVPHMATPTVDGVLDDWPKTAPALIDAASATIVNPELYDGDQDLRVQMHAGWSEQGLHLAFSVDDDAVVDVPGRASWEVDGIEIFVDGRAEAKRTDRYTSKVSQNILPVLRPQETIAGNNAWHSGFSWVTRQRPGGYNTEISIPFARLRGVADAVPVVGDTVRFDVKINDRDQLEGSQSHHALWSTGAAWSSTSGYGILVLRR